LYESGESDSDGSFYPNHAKQITCEFEHLKLSTESESDPISNANFQYEEIVCEIRKLKYGKKGGWDTITNEHLKYGGLNLAYCISHLFNAMYSLGYVPSGMKKGLIYTLYKGSRKYEDDRKNYRGISLLPVIDKLFERVILSRFKNWIETNKIHFPSPNQHAYQESLCSVLASFEVQETINYNCERRSKTYVGLLDSSSAFDTVWHGGLFVKLHQMGIRGKLWRLLFESYRGMQSQVVFNGMVSEVINIRQSVRQGSVLGPWLYMMYIHDLAVTLQSSQYGCKVGQVSCGGVLQADDIVIMALTPLALQNLLLICEDYSRNWRYKYNPIKSKILVFGEGPRTKHRLHGERTFLLYGKEVEQVSESVHVGITLNAHGNNTTRTANAVSKMRRSFMSIKCSGTNSTGMSCLTAIKLYRTVVLPRCLYGAELWLNLTDDHLKQIEIAHHFCLKIIQAMPKRTKTCIIQSMVNVYSIETYIDLKKLLFMGRLCRLDCTKLAKQMFLERLYQHIYNSKSRSGFIADVIQILEKYGLMQYVKEYMSSYYFPNKSHWKCITQSHAKLFEENKLQFKLRDHKLKRFSQVYGLSLNVHPIWYIEHNTKGHRRHFKDLAKLNGVLYGMNQNKACAYCNRPFCDHLDHYIHSCDKYRETREYFWTLIVNVCSVQLSSYLHNLTDYEQTCVILGQKPSLVITGNEHCHFQTICAKVWQRLAYERELPFY
jgi:hypothetical protein